MTKPESDRVPSAEWASRGQTLDRSFASVQLPRLAHAAEVHSPIRLTARFQRDARGRDWIEGRIQGRPWLPCQRCEAAVEFVLEVPVRLCLVDEAAAQLLEDEPDLYVTEDGWLDLAALVEDEVLLALPALPCRESDCPRAPVMTYPPDSSETLPTRPNPFAALEQLKRKDSNTTE